MKNTHRSFLTLTAALVTGIAFAQSPPDARPPRPSRPGDAPGQDAREPRPPRPGDERDDAPRRPDSPPPRGFSPQGGRPDVEPPFGASNNFPRPMKLQPFLGVITRPVEPELAAQLGLTEGLGLIVEEVVPDSPAATAGLQRHDVLKQIGDQLVANPAQLAALVRHFGKDAETAMVLVRKGQEQKLTVKIGERMMPERMPLGSGFPGGGGEFGSVGLLRARSSADIFQEIGPGAPPEVRAREEQTSTTWNTSSAKVTLKDDSGEMEVRSENGKRTLIAKNAKGETVFNGPIDTDEQRRTIPEDFRKKLEQIDVSNRTDRRPNPPQPGERPRPRAEDGRPPAGPHGAQ